MVKCRVSWIPGSIRSRSFWFSTKKKKKEGRNNNKQTDHHPSAWHWADQPGGLGRFPVCFLQDRIMLEHWATKGPWDHMLCFIVYTAHASYWFANGKHSFPIPLRIEGSCLRREKTWFILCTNTSCAANSCFQDAHRSKRLLGMGSLARLASAWQMYPKDHCAHRSTHREAASLPSAHPVMEKGGQRPVPRDGVHHPQKP